MLRSILVALGEGDLHHAAVEVALRWAREKQALLVGLGIVDTDAAAPREAVPLGAGHLKLELDAARRHALERDVECCLSGFALRCTEAGVPYKLLEDVGRAAEQIAEEAQRFDLIVLPRRSHYVHAQTPNGFGRVLWEILHLASRPVVVVPEGAHEAEDVVIAYDGSLQAARTLQLFEATGLVSGRPVHVVSLAADRVHAARVGDRAVEFLDRHDVRATLHAAVAQRNVGDQILAIAQRLSPGLLVMGAYGQPRMRDFLLGSVTRTVLAGSSVPLFVSH